MFSLGVGEGVRVRKESKNCKNVRRGTDELGLNYLEFWNWNWNSYFLFTFLLRKRNFRHVVKTSSGIVCNLHDTSYMK